MTSSQKVTAVGTTLGCQWIRFQIVLSTWSGSSSILELAETAGLKYMPVITAFPTSSAQPWPDDLEEVASTLNNIYDTYPKITVVCVGNEEINPIFNTGTPEEYVAFLQTVYTVSHARGIKVMNGGYGNHPGINIVVYRWLVTKYNQGAADDWADVTEMTSGQINAADDPGSNSGLELQVTAVEEIIAASAYFDYINVHRYEEKLSSETAISINMFRYMKECFEAKTKRPYVNNETGIWCDITPEEIGANQATLTTNMMNEFYRLGIEHIQIYDAQGSQAIPFTDDTTGSILANGTALNTFLQTHQN